MGILSVIVDSREPDWAKKLTFGGVPVIVKPLEVGDFWVITTDQKVLIIERKTPDDFIGSVISQRIFHQAAHMATMRDSGYWPYIIITGQIQRNIDGTVYTSIERKFNWNAAQGAKLSIQELGIPVLECAGDTDFENSIIRLSERSRDEKMVIKPIKSPVFMDGETALLCSLPGIGIETVTKVLDYCGSAGWAIAELSDPNSKIKIPGIGPGVKNNIRWALGLKENEMLAVSVQEEKEKDGKR